MDFKLPLSCVLIVGGALGLALPALPDLKQSSAEGSDESRGPSAPPHAGQTIAFAQSQSSEAATGWSDEFALERQGDGHFYADVNLDGFSTHMLVDTGASVIALTGEDAAAMGLSWDASEIKPVAQGANGPVLGLNISLPRVSVGGFEATNVPALIVPEGLGISLLGQSFLSAIDKVEISGDRMVLSN